MPNGQTVATAVIGNDGAVGILTALGPSLSPMTAVVRVAGTSLQISPARFHAALSRSGAVRHAVQIYTRALLAQFQHVAACNALHSVEARMARWLLHIHDRADGDVLPLTQEALSELLGVRRTTVTHVVRKLRSSRAIRSNRRGLIEIDRPRLEAAACECYEVMRRRIDRIVSPEEMKPRIHAPPVQPKSRVESPFLGQARRSWTRQPSGATSSRSRTAIGARGHVATCDGPLARQLAASSPLSRSARKPRLPWRTIRDWLGRSSSRCARRTPYCIETSLDPLSCPSGSSRPV